jgi:hypothetical protein
VDGKPEILFLKEIEGSKLTGPARAHGKGSSIRLLAVKLSVFETYRHREVVSFNHHSEVPLSGVGAAHIRPLTGTPSGLHDQWRSGWMPFDRGKQSLR